MGDTGQGWQSGAEAFSAAVPHAKFICPTAPTIPLKLQGGMSAPAWCDPPISGPADMMNAITMKPGRIDASINELAQMIRQESVEHGIPPSRIVLIGFSLGGCLAAAATVQMRMQCAGLVMLSTMVLGPSFLKLSECYKDVPVLYCHGTADSVIPYFAAQMTKGQMEQMGITVRFHEHSGGHEPGGETMKLTGEFLAERLPVAEPESFREEAAQAAVAGALLPAGLGFQGRIPDGAAVTVRGLKAQPQHNGVVGEVVGHNSENGRLTVRLPPAAGAEKPLALRPQNLTQHVGVTVLAGGSEGTLVDYDDESKLFRVSKADAEAVELPAEAFRLPPGTAVRVAGLQSEKGQALNDRFAVILRFSDEEERYIVEMGEEKHKMKPGNVFP